MANALARQKKFVWAYVGVCERSNETEDDKKELNPMKHPSVLLKN